MLGPLTTQIVGSYTKPHWLARHAKMRTLDGSWWRPEPEVLAAAQTDAALLSIYEQERGNRWRGTSRRI
jgi:5-methyltetrahydropteroyltriglutamate--homocysteine methyltransferase